MWPFSSGQILDQAVMQGFGNLQQPRQQPAYQGLGQQNKVLSNPQLLDALGRMGSAISRANNQGSGFGGSLAAGFDAFQDEKNRQQQFALESRMAEADIMHREAQAEQAKRDALYGVRSQGFEGDIARARVILNSPQASEEDKATAQAVIETAQRMTGSWDPSNGEFVYNQKARFGNVPGMVPSAAPMGPTNPQIQTQDIPAPTMQAPAGGLLPPPAMGQTPDQSMFTGNRKVDAALQEERGKAEIAGRKAVNEGVAKVDAETFGLMANQTRTLASMVPQLKRIEALAANTQTGGIGVARKEFGKVFGLDIEGLPEAQAIEAIQNAIGPSLRTPGSGSSSDRDVAIFMSSIPTLMNTPQGIREINRTYEALLGRKKEEEKIARRLLNEDGNLENFYAETEKLGPVFKDAPKPEKTRLRFNPQTGALE